MALSDITPIKRSEEYLQRIADAIENSGGSDLPTVTSDDNGDVLTVVNGAWDKAAPASQLPAVTSGDDGDVLTVVNGEWNKAAAPSSSVVVEASATYTNGVAQLMTAAITEILTSGGNRTASVQYSNLIVTDDDAAAIENMCENWATAPATLHAMGDYFTPAVVTNEAVQTNIPCYGYTANNVSYFFNVKIITNARTKSVTMVVVLDYVDAGQT